MRLCFQLLNRRPALITEGLSGWKAYPVVLEAVWHGGHLELNVQVDVAYSSTCPCSAALARQIVQTAFTDAFAGVDSLTPLQVAEWLRSNATAATPHSQRSVARVKVKVGGRAQTFGVFALIDLIEVALGTPVQTAVKRADEQEFARLNGQNLMYVEDASRKIQKVLEPSYKNADVFVSHLESLHPHNAVAWSTGAVL
jgi:GTP cyclohydrolase I